MTKNEYYLNVQYFKISIQFHYQTRELRQERKREREREILFQVKTHTATLRPAVFITVLSNIHSA